MTLLEIEQLLSQLRQQIISNTAAIVTLNNTISNYATTDDLNAIAVNLNILQQNNTQIQTDLNTLKNIVDNSDHLNKLIDVSINNLTEGDVLCYGSTGKWHNIQVNLTGSSGSTGNVTRLNDLSDVQLSALSDGQSLVYNSAIGMWINATVSSSGSGGGSISGNYLTKDYADSLYLSKYGGTVNGDLTITGFTTINDNLLVKGGITSYNE